MHTRGNEKELSRANVLRAVAAKPGLDQAIDDKDEDGLLNLKEDRRRRLVKFKPLEQRQLRHIVVVTRLVFIFVKYRHRRA